MTAILNSRNNKEKKKGKFISNWGNLRAKKKFISQIGNPEVKETSTEKKVEEWMKKKSF